MSATELLSNAGPTATGSAENWFGGRGTAHARGTFGGSTVSVELAPPGTTHWRTVPRDGTTSTLTFSSGGVDVGSFAAWSRWDVRGNVNGGSTNTSVTVRLAARALLGST